MYIAAASLQICLPVNRTEAR